MMSSQRAPRISIVIPCHNAAPFIGTTIESLRAQDVDDWECIIVDDGSTDASLTVVDELAARDARLVVLSQPNQGVHRARQAGYEHTTPSSEYLVFLDADDTLEPRFLSTLASHLEAHPAIGLVYGTCVHIDAAGNRLEPQPQTPRRYVPVGLRVREVHAHEPETPLAALVSGHEAIPSATMLRRSVFERTRGWRRVGVIEDKDIVMQMALLAPVHFLPVPLTRYRHHPTNRSLDHFYESMQGLHDQWWHDASLDREDRRRVRAAIAFDRRLAALAAERSARNAPLST